MGVGFGAHGQAMAAGAGVTIKNSACITVVKRHADAGYTVAVACAREMGLKLPIVQIPRKKNE